MYVDVDGAFYTPKAAANVHVAARRAPRPQGKRHVMHYTWLARGHVDPLEYQLPSVRSYHGIDPARQMHGVYARIQRLVARDSSLAATLRVGKSENVAC